jgi:hypothetical protein
MQGYYGKGLLSAEPAMVSVSASLIQCDACVLA